MIKNYLALLILVFSLSGCGLKSSIYNPQGVPAEELAIVGQEFIYSEHVFIRSANGVDAEGLSNPLKSNRLEKFSPGEYTFYWTLQDGTTYLGNGYLKAKLTPAGKYFIGFKKENRKIISGEVQIWEQSTGEVVSVPVNSSLADIFINSLRLQQN